MDDLYGHIRKYWPNKRTKTTASDGYENSDPPSDQSQVEAAVAAGTQVAEAQEEEGPGFEEELQENIDDMELAEALGVPSEIVEILSPKKIPGSEEVETTRVEVSKPEIALTAQEKRDLRIQELKSLGPIITFFSCFVPCVPSFPRFQTFYDFVCPFPAHCSAAQAAVGAGQSPEDCNAGGW